MVDAPDSDLVMAISHGHWQAAGLQAALQHKLFDRLHYGPLTAPQVATAASLPANSTELLLEALVGMKLLAERDSFYSNTATATAHLVTCSPDYLGSLCLALTSAGGIWGVWRDFDATVAAGGAGPAVPVEGFDNAQFRQALVRGIMPLTSRAARQTVKTLGLADRAHLRVLDVGGGSGVYSEIVLEANPAATALQIDGPRINAGAHQRLLDSPIRERFSTIDASFPRVDLDSGTFDLIVYSGFAHLQSDEKNASDIARCRELLAPDGQFVLHDYLSHTGAESEPSRITNVNWLLVGHGRVWPLPTVERWLNDAGFSRTCSEPTGLWMTLVHAS